MKTATEVSSGTGLRVLEMYPAVQGEGTRVGVPSTFLRLAGCTVGCEWCDTKYSWKASQGIDLTIDQIVGQVLEMTPLRSVVLTGGEPLEHPLEIVGPLIRRLASTCHVTIETSATLSPEDLWLLVQYLPISDQILWSLSPKLKSAKSTKPFPDLNDWLEASQAMGHDLQLKFVISSDEDLFQVASLLPQLSWRLRSLPTSIILQTMTRTDKPDDELRTSIIDDLRSLQESVAHWTWTTFLPPTVTIRVLPQLHAIIYGKRRGI